jgi:Phage head completion protein (GPL)
VTFVSVPPAPASPGKALVSAGDWWPEIDCNAMRDALRIGEIVTHERLVAEVQNGLLTVLGELREWKAARVLEGHASLAAFAAASAPGDEIDGVSHVEHLFVRAVRCTAAAGLVELHRDIAASEQGQNRSESNLQTAADYRRMATWALRDILGVTRTAVELI